jgi:hypothetical protein
MTEAEIRKLIHIWQVKLYNKEDTMDFAETEIAQILECFGCIRASDDFIEDSTIDLYDLWERGVQINDPSVTDEDLENPRYMNEKALAVMNAVIERTNKYYESKRA